MENLNLRQPNSRILLGILLIAGGALFLLQNLGLLPFGGYVWALVFAVAGALFLWVYGRDRQNWWAIIPGLTLLGIGAIIALALLAPGQAGAWIGGVFLGSIGLAFWIVYLTNRSYWWAIIPGGTLVTLAIIAGITPLYDGSGLGALFFLGLGLTFALVAVLPTPVNRDQTKWAFIPAIVMLVMGALILAASTSLINYIWPIALVAGGLYLVWRSYRSRIA